MQPELAALKEQGVDLYVIAIGSEKDLSWFFNEVQLEATIIHDTDFSIFQKYSVVALPSLLLIDKEGRVAFNLVGWGLEAFTEQIQPLLTDLLAE